MNVDLVAPAVQLLAVRRDERLLAVGLPASAARLLAGLVGKQGMVVMLATADGEAPDLPNVHFTGQRARGHYGSFDALLLAMPIGPVPTLGACADLARDNLRPGGRFVIDLPGAPMLPELHATATDLGWSTQMLAPWTGCGDTELRDCLNNAGLRGVHGGPSTMLLACMNAGELVDQVTATLTCTDAERLQLAHALVRRRGNAGPIECVLHRVRYNGRR